MLSNLHEDAKAQLQLYLRRVRELRDYRNGGETQKNVIRIVYEAIQLAERNEEFRNAFVSIIYEGTLTCGDRVHTILIDIEMLNLVHGKEWSDEEFSDVAIRLSRYEFLKKHAKKAGEERRLGDEIETTLYYFLRLKKEYNFPITTVDMLYERTAGVNDKMLEAARAEIGNVSSLKWLAASDYWLSRMERKHPVEARQINEFYTELLEKAQEIDFSRAPLVVEDELLRQIIEDAKKEEEYECKDYKGTTDLIKQKWREARASLKTGSAAAGAE